MEIARTVTTDAPISVAFDYLSDFTNSTEWDAGTVKTTLNSGTGGVGTSYHNVSSFLGKETELTYVVEEFVKDAVYGLRGENKTVVAHDTMTFTATPTGGTEVHYKAVFEFKGIARFAVPFLGPAFRKLGDGAEKGMHDALSRLAG